MNEILFISQTIISLIIVLIAFRAGKTWLYALIALYYALANIFVTKTIVLFGLEATGGNVLYGAIFLSTDLLSEYYGKAAARKGVYIGFAAVLVYLIMSQFMVYYEASSNDWGPAEGMATIFSFAPSIIFASLSAYLISQIHDVWAFERWKRKFGGKYLWLRNNLSTWVSQFLDTVIFCVLGFYLFPRLLLGPAAALPVDVIWQIALTTYLLKILVAAIDTPFIYLSRRWLPPDVIYPT